MFTINPIGTTWESKSQAVMMGNRIKAEINQDNEQRNYTVILEMLALNLNG